jgi:hypothetical protein
MFTSMMRRALFGSGDSALLSLDFTAGTVPTALTFTRADSTARATFIDASGYVKTVASAGAARFDYTGGVAKGLLIEAAATNYMLYSTALNPHSTFNMRTIATASITDPEGTTDKARIIAADGTTGYHVRFVAITAGTNTTITISIFAKKNGYKYLHLADGGSGRSAVLFDLDDGTTSNSAGPGFVSASAISYPNGWWRCSMVVNVTASTSYAWGYVGVPTTGATLSAYGAQYTGANTDTDGIYCYGFQVEAGSVASSLIKTTTAALTRLADDAVIRSTAWTGLYAQPGAMVVEFYRGAYGAGDRSVLATDTTAARHWDLLHANGSATSQIAFSSGSAVTQTGLVSGLNKVALAWNAPTPTASFDLCVNGATPTFGGSNVGTTLSTWLTLGSQSTTGVSGSGTWDNYLNNSIKSVKYYTGLTYAEMQAKTT